MAIIHGDNQILEACRSALYDTMVDMKTVMDTDVDDPRPSAIYNTHDQVKVSLPSISVEILEITDDGSRVEARAAGVGDVVVRYPILCEIRVHTAFEGEYIDLIKVSRLLNSVSNWIETHRDFSSDIDSGSNVFFQVTSVGDIITEAEFPESLTIGGKMELTLIATVTHTQA